MAANTFLASFTLIFLMVLSNRIIADKLDCTRVKLNTGSAFGNSFIPNWEGTQRAVSDLFRAADDMIGVSGVMQRAKAYSFSILKRLWTKSSITAFTDICRTADLMIGITGSLRAIPRVAMTGSNICIQSVKQLWTKQTVAYVRDFYLSADRMIGITGILQFVRETAVSAYDRFLNRISPKHLVGSITSACMSADKMIGISGIARFLWAAVEPPGSWSAPISPPLSRDARTH
jgi:hypothetical protein